MSSKTGIRQQALGSLAPVKDMHARTSYLWFTAHLWPNWPHVAVASVPSGPQNANRDGVSAHCRDWGVRLAEKARRDLPGGYGGQKGRRRVFGQFRWGVGAFRRRFF
jgi:hypothetical protein